MHLLELVQGTNEWKATRLSHFTASEAPIMMGASKLMSRDDLLTYKTTKIEKEVSRFQQIIFDKGHETEEKARPLAEAIIGDELFPVTGRLDVEELPLLASFDGITMLEDIGFEHKQWNEEKAQALNETNEIAEEHYWQLEHQLLVSGADYMLFVMSDGTEDKLIAQKYHSVPERRAQLIAGWKQFQEDLKGYTPKEYTPTPEGKSIQDLPALSIEITGGVKGSNLPAYKSRAMAFIEAINTDLVSDQDFADAEKAVKFCSKAEKELETVKKKALSDTADIEELFSTVDHLKEEMRKKRLFLNKLIKERKESIKRTIVTDRENQLNNFIREKNAELDLVHLPGIETDFASAMKGKKTLKSLEESANDELAKAKISVNNAFEHISTNVEIFKEAAKGAEHLFSDIQLIIMESPEALTNIIAGRLAQNDLRELERKKNEEQAKANALLNARSEAQEAQEVEPEPVTKKQADIAKVLEPMQIEEYLFQHFGLTMQQAKAIQTALVEGRVPHMKYAPSRAQAA